METLLLNLGLSFTQSKALSYAIFVLLGFLFAFLFFKKSKSKKAIRISISLGLFIIPFLIYFAIHPIYEGDFSNNSYPVESKIDFPKKKQLTIIALANCPYCIQSIETSKLLKKNNPGIRIEYWVLSTNPVHLLKYKKLLGNTAQVKLKAGISDDLAVLAKGSYPTFVISDTNRAIKAWNNDSFGVMAMDEVCGGS